MSPPIDVALTLSDEQDWLDFKREFDPTSAAEWCELVKDIVAIANSGGGFIVFGVSDDGSSSGHDVRAALELDTATIADKVRRYTGARGITCAIHRRLRAGTEVAVLEIEAVRWPLVFTSVGSYELPDKKQGRAFSVGQVYFRHGTKSEPGASEDLRQFVDREVSRQREEWLGNVRKVVEAPAGSVVSVTPATPLEVVRDGDAIPARLVHAADAAPVPWRSPDITHPFRQKEVVAEINNRLDGRGHVNGFDIQLVRRHFKSEDDPNLVYKPKFGTFQYSPAFVDWLVKEFERDQSFFTALRARSRT